MNTAMREKKTSVQTRSKYSIFNTYPDPKVDHKEGIEDDQPGSAHESTPATMTNGLDDKYR